MTRFFLDMADNPFLAAGLVAGLLASLACGVIGPYVITRRIVFLSGAIAHTALGGIGAAVFLANNYPVAFGWCRPIHGAVLTAIIAAVTIGIVQQHVAERIDTLIGAMWAIGMAIGVMLIKFTPGYHTELMSYLFGNIAFFSWDQVRLIVALDAIIILAVLTCHKQLLAICCDQEHAQLQGVNVLAANILLLTLVALTVICLIQLVGLILVIALLTLPAATAAHHVSRMVPMMCVAVVLCALVTTVPRVAVYGTALSPESVIVLSAGGVYLASVFWQRARSAPR